MDRIVSAFGPTSTAREVVANHDLSGRTAIVTGGGSGLGLETARALAEAGAEVFLAVRRQEAGDQGVTEIDRTASGKARVELLDLSSFASIRDFAARWGTQPLDLLIENAGVMACPLATTADGLEMQIGTNHFGHYLLAVLLLPALEAGHRRSGRCSRVVVLSSGAHRQSAVDFDDPHYRNRPYHKWGAYGQSKTANALFAIGLTQRYKDRGIVANAVMPGMIRTNLIRHLSDEDFGAMGSPGPEVKLPPGYKTPEQGAATSVWAAVGEELEGVGGLYLENCAQAVPGTPEGRGFGVLPHAQDPVAADRLWRLSEETTGA
jgi:NAD(P)-dependent dehydrogenase (short-subunit alcohol dehydrogenase family)